MRNKIYYTVTDSLGVNHDCSLIYGQEYTTDEILLDLHWRRYHDELGGGIVNSKYVVDFRIKRKVYIE